MTARQPRRARRRLSPATTLPRPAAMPVAQGAEDEQAQPAGAVTSARVTRRQFQHREHHVTTDYSHVHRDLLTVVVVGILVLSFIFGMSFVLQR